MNKKVDELSWDIDYAIESAVQNSVGVEKARAEILQAIYDLLHHDSRCESQYYYGKQAISKCNCQKGDILKLLGDK